MIRFTITLMTCLILVSTSMTWAAQAQDIGIEQAILDMNRIKPMQNPNWERSASVMKSRIQDRKNKVMGDLEDITIDTSGNIKSLRVDLDRLQLGTDIVLNYDDMNIRSGGRAYILGFEEEQLQEFYPQILASIETASGENSDRISVRNIINSDVMAADGRRIGKVEDVMFDELGSVVEALVIRVRYRMVGGESVAIPFSMAEYKPDRGNRYNVTLSNADADSVLSIAESR